MILGEAVGFGPRPARFTLRMKRLSVRQNERMAHVLGGLRCSGTEGVGFRVGLEDFGSKGMGFRSTLEAFGSKGLGFRLALQAFGSKGPRFRFSPEAFGWKRKLFCEEALCEMHFRFLIPFG